MSLWVSVPILLHNVFASPGLSEALCWFWHFKHGLPFNCSDRHLSQNPAQLTWRTYYGWPREASGHLHKIHRKCRGYRDYFTRCLDIRLSKLTLWPILRLLENKLPHLLQCVTVHFAVTFPLDVAVGSQLWSDRLLICCENLCQLQAAVQLKGNTCHFNSLVVFTEQRKGRYGTVFSSYWYLLST